MRSFRLTFAALGFATVWSLGATAAVPVVAAENFYGDVARQIGGDAVSVVSILSNPDQDPHEFEASPETAKALSAAKLVIQNGIDYDPWMTKLLGASKAGGRRVIVVADLMRRHDGDNPHLWYDPATMPAVAGAIAAELKSLDPIHAEDFARRLAAFNASMAPIAAKIATLRERHAGAAVTATEPVFGEMAKALGLKMRDEKFQIAIMNDTEPAAGDVAAFENGLRGHAARVLFYNVQATGGISQRMRDIAGQAGIPVVGVSETEPQGVTYQDWMSNTLNAVGKALAAPGS